MLQKTFSILFLIFGISVGISVPNYGQTYTITYDEQKLSEGIITFENAAYSSNIKGLPLFLKELESMKSGYKVVANLQILASKTLPWTFSNEFPQEYISKTTLLKIEGTDHWMFELVPVRVNGQNLELITSFSIQVDQVPNENPSLRNDPVYTFESVLTSGDVYKIGIKNTGVHKLDFAFLENKLGIKTGQINPKNIKIYGNGGGRLPVSNATSRNDDLVENAILVSGENDGKFDNGDFVLFYAEGADVWRYNETTNQFGFDKNIYDDFNYYFLKIDGGPGLRITEVADVADVPGWTSDEFETIQHYESDLTNLLGANPGTHGTGKEWYGEYFRGTREMDFTSKFDFSNAVTGSEGQARALFVGRSGRSSNVVYKIHDNTFTQSIGGVATTDLESLYAQKAVLNQKFVVSTNNQKIIVEYPAVSAESEGWLDYVQLIFKKRLVNTPNQWFFQNRESRTFETARYLLQIPSDVLVWDITDPLRPMIQKTGSNGFSFKTGLTVRRFISHRGLSNALEPESGVKVVNQNLHAITDVDMLVVYHPDFKDAVQKFTDHRTSFSKIKIATAEIGSVYNEFSSGKSDPVAIRDIARMLYIRNPSFQNLLLFGDGSYDYKGLMPNINRENFVPIYATDQSLHPITGFPADDFFGLLDENEGGDLLGGLDISVGRLPAKSLTEANVFVDKIIHYDTSPEALGDWRLRTAYAADDEDTGTHIYDTDEIARTTFSNFPLFNQQKVYFDAFPQVSTAGDPRYPEATKSINNNVFAGHLTFTYLGHGGPQGFAQERVLTLKDIKGWTNYDKMFLMITATCSFAAYDDPKAVSPGEETILNPKGGAIALYSTTRAVFTNSNKALTDAVHREIYRKTDGKNPTFGQVLKDGKNKYTGSFTVENSRKFTLLGDPSQSIALPKDNIVLTKVNKKPIETSTDTLKAMTFVEFEGYVADENLAILSDFNGSVNTTIFDKASKLKTLQNDQRSPSVTFDLYQNVIFKGKATVKNGLFSFGFWVPKDINYTVGEGRISMYASDGEKRDAGGYYNKIKIGGSSTNGIVDDTPPNVDVFMNDESFVQGGITNANPVLLVKLSDDFGINVTGNAVGHDITSVLNDETSEAIVLNEFFESEKDSYTAGMIRYPLKDLPEGKHTIRVKAWDIANNSAEKETDFMVVGSEREFLERVLNYPNPFTTNTRFEFEHDLSNTSLDIHVYIYSVSGKLVKTIEHSSFYPGNRVNDVRWNGRDDYEDRLARGVYLYKIKVFARDLNVTRESRFEKLVIL
ncbi:MAG: type IX secretion system sortase PorU [Saprospiraceae bacterium]|nr:type IX secretion system sortase PorU [Saprospiraceae bacterium]